MDLAPGATLDETGDALISRKRNGITCKRVERPSLSRLSGVDRQLSLPADRGRRGQAIAAACVIAGVSGKWDTVLALLAAGNVDLEQEYNGRTALMVAAEHAQALPVLRALIRLGATCGFVGL